MKNIKDKLEFYKIKEMLKDFAHSDNTKIEIDKLMPFLSYDQCERRINETTAARKIIDALGLPPLPYSASIEDILNICNRGELPTPEQLMEVRLFADSCGKMIKYLNKSEYLDIRISSYRNSMADLRELKEEIERCIRNDEVDSRASDELAKLRNEIEKSESEVKSKTESILRKNSKWFSENYISKRNGHYVLPVKKQFRNQFDGSVIEVSGSGVTYFMEPASVTRLQNKLEELRMKEEEEVRRILYVLAAMILENGFDIKKNIDITDQLDMIFAKGRLSQAQEGNPAGITTVREIKIINGRHPLLDKEKCVPLNFTVNEGISGVIITGPNTGGKTVALKTVGLLSMMAQCGLHVPANEGSLITMHSSYMCDIGDDQSISENLSTFSAHMTNIIEILGAIDAQSLVIMDELGSGTDPTEGMGIAIAVMEELRRKGCMFLISTHYPEVKDYSRNTDGIQSARMAFDKETLTPLYRLELGETGDSCALHIAKELGLPDHILNDAHDAAYHNEKPSELGTHKKSYAGKVIKNDSRHSAKSRIIPKKEEADGNEDIYVFKIGDSVKILPDSEIGIVYKPRDSKGELCIQVKGEKKMFNHKRVKLHLPAESLYPEDYDMSIVFDSVENRKARNKLDKGNPIGVIDYKE